MLNLEKEAKISLRNLALIFAFSLLLGIIFELFFYQHTLGLSFPIYIGLVLIGYLILSPVNNKKYEPQPILLAIVSLALSAMVFYRANMYLTAINVAASIFIILLAVMSSVGLKLIKSRLKEYLLTLFIPLEFISTYFGFMSDLGQHMRYFREHQLIGQIIRGILITLPVVSVLAVLLSSADMVFDKYLRDIVYLDITFDTFVEIFIALAITSLFMGAFYFIYTKDNYSFRPVQEFNKQSSRKEMSLVELSILLGSINMLFLLFIIVQIAYLFGGQNNILSVEGLTYAEYARKGFFELIGVALISYLIIWNADLEVLKSHEAKPLSYKMLTGLLVALVLVIMLSAFKRLVLYEEAFGFTTLRLYSHFFTVWLGAVFLLLFYKVMIDNNNEGFIFRTVIVSIAFFFAINFINPDRFIAQKNVDRYLQTGKIDIEYLRELSVDATPEILRLVDAKEVAVAGNAAESLLGELKLLNSQDKTNKWFSTKQPAVRTKELLEPIKDKLEKARKGQFKKPKTPVKPY